MTSEQPEGGVEHTEWEAVCHKDGCRGIDHGPYSRPKYARSDKSAHEKWHEQRGETADVEVVKRTVSSDTDQIKATETFIAETETISDVNEATKRFNRFLNEVRSDGGSQVRVALVEVFDGE